MNLNHFYYFYEVARHGSFTRAARDLAMSQSALSVQVKSLEDSLGGPLFDRNRNGVRLTETGERAYHVAERVFQDIDQMLSDLRESERHIKGVVTVATVNSIGIYVLPEVLTAFREQIPDVDVKIDFQEADEVVELLYNGRADFAILPWNRKQAELLGVPLRRTKMFLVAPPAHPLAESIPVSPRDLERHRFVGYQEGMYTRSVTDALFKRMSLDVDYVIESTNAATIKHMVMAGMGLAFLPEFAVAGELRRGQLVRIELPSFVLAEEITLYFRKNRTMSHSRAQFAQFLQDYFAPRPTRRGQRRTGKPPVAAPDA